MAALRGGAVRALSRQFAPYAWAPSTEEIAARAGIPAAEVVRFDGNTPPRPPDTARVDALADALARVNTYPHGGYPQIHETIAAYAGVEPGNIVLGAGADDLILLCARAFAAPRDCVAIADEPTYPLFRTAAWLAGADVGDDDPVLTFCCRPHNPTGALVDIPEARPLVVDEAYFEYARETIVDTSDDGLVVIRTFSKAFGLAGARIGYAVASAAVAEELRVRQSPAPVSTLSVALALAGLAAPPDVTDVLEERERLAERLRSLGLDPLPSRANFVYVRLARADEIAERLLLRGLAVRPFGDAMRITVRNRVDDDRLVAALAEIVGSLP